MHVALIIVTLCITLSEFDRCGNPIPNNIIPGLEPVITLYLWIIFIMDIVVTTISFSVKAAEHHDKVWQNSNR